MYSNSIYVDTYLSPQKEKLEPAVRIGILLQLQVATLMTLPAFVMGRH